MARFDLGVERLRIVGSWCFAFRGRIHSGQLRSGGGQLIVGSRDSSGGSAKSAASLVGFFESAVDGRLPSCGKKEPPSSAIVLRPSTPSTHRTGRNRHRRLCRGARSLLTWPVTRTPASQRAASHVASNGLHVSRRELSKLWAPAWAN